MNVSLTPEIRAFVTDRIASGRFQNASEVVRGALRLLDEDENRRHTRKMQAESKADQRA